MKQKKDKLPDYSLGNDCFNQFVNNFSESLLLCKINVLDTFNMVDV